MACILVEAELQNMKEQFIEADRDLDTLDQVKRLFYLMNKARQLINLLVRNYWLTRQGSWLGMRLDHEANIRDGGKTVHVVFLYLSKKPAVERGEAGGVTPPPSAPPDLFPSWSVNI
jgi:hypothetical protein